MSAQDILDLCKMQAEQISQADTRSILWLFQVTFKSPYTM